MSKQSVYTCNQCTAQFIKWAGKCAECGTWNSLTEESIQVSKNTLSAQARRSIQLADVNCVTEVRLDCGFAELNRVLGGGLVVGSIALIGGAPGIGKSTLLLQTLAKLSQHHPVLYVTGEESLAQVALRAQRLGLAAHKVQLLAETRVATIIATAQRESPKVIVIDSIQTMDSQTLSSAPGSVSQIRESAAQLVQFAKNSGIALFIVGHVTKEGAIAGPRVLEHMVDTVLYFEGSDDSRFRMIRAVKNRFGAVNELGIFAMADKGLREVKNPSAIFLSRQMAPTPGSVIMATWEGTRPMLVEVQALVTETQSSNPRRVTLGLDQNRLVMLLAVLQRHTQLKLFNQDVFVNIVGGMRITETAADLAVLLAVVSSLHNQIIPKDQVVFGEVGLAGEIRPVQSGLERIAEAHKHGFKRAIVPAANVTKQSSAIEVIPAATLQAALTIFNNQNRSLSEF